MSTEVEGSVEGEVSSGAEPIQAAYISGGIAHVGSDMDKGTTMGDADGPDVFIAQLGMVVPTFIDPRDDLITENARGKFQRLSHHVPYKMRGNFFPHQWPIEYYNTVRGGLHLAVNGLVLCHGMKRQGQGLCNSKAVNRSMFCRNHGGALHPADKKMSDRTLGMTNTDARMARMDRLSRFMQGLLKPHELDDDEVKGQFIRNSQGEPIRTIHLGTKYVAIVRKELHERLNNYLLMETPEMLKVMVGIAENDMYEAADRIKAAQWISERTMGKTPDVLIHSTTAAPYTSILDSLDAGSREEHRKAIESSRVSPGGVDGLSHSAYEVIDAEIEPDDDEDELDDDEDEEGSDSDDDQQEFQGQQETGMWAGPASVEVRPDSGQESRQEKLERIKAIKKAKSRRYAARASGATSLISSPWLVEYVPIYGESSGGKGRELTGHAMKLYPPDKQTPGLVDRLMRKPSFANGRNPDG